ncbi:hypothetical protein [Anaerosacchariphilus polymeriproducens]|uniref:DUF4352 domain-containing protein n=1 Tax=Anaerosacchariphilus polymeriproducens TaxID=1812858 RepID=A0A371AYX0_9FIRM|nr:hypothetical protein [Anaerosacchariphilus polymeriproducens]RDU24794.1 hypothetical protein DWV06_02120 [Anaerosacchariphilus polymeriproducens]
MKKFGVVLIIMNMFLTGCASTYNLTEKQSDIISTYAAQVVLKHDKNYDDTLVNVPENSESNKNTQEDKTEVKENIQDNKEGVKTEEEKISLSKALGMQDIQIDYVNYELNRTYAEENALAKSSSGKKSLLIMHFNLKNITSEEKLCDILSLNPEFHVIINKDYTIKVQPSILLSDLGTYKQSIGTGETKGAVLISEAETKKFENIKSLELKVTIKGTTFYVKL